MKLKWAIFFCFLLLQNESIDGHKHHGQNSNLAQILAAGLIVQMLSREGHHHKHQHHGHHGHESRHNQAFAQHHHQHQHQQPHNLQESRHHPGMPLAAMPAPMPWGGYGYAQPQFHPAMESMQQLQFHQAPILPQSTPYINSIGQLTSHAILP